MKKMLLTIVLVISISTNVKPQVHPSSFYISPGISLSWGGNSKIIFGWKFSIGYVKSEEYYYNITFGKKDALNLDVEAVAEDYKYLEIQAGSFFDYSPLSAGGGLGITFLDSKIYPKLSLFGGSLFFATLNYTYNRNIFDLGCSLALPYPFNEELRDLGPG